MGRDITNAQMTIHSLAGFVGVLVFQAPDNPPMLFGSFGAAAAAAVQRIDSGPFDLITHFFDEPAQHQVPAGNDDRIVELRVGPDEFLIIWCGLGLLILK